MGLLQKSTRPAAFCRNGAVENEVRPHPSPLPQERENHLSGLERIAVSERGKTYKKLSLSLGERAGVRASFFLNCMVTDFRQALGGTPYVSDAVIVWSSGF